MRIVVGLEGGLAGVAADARYLRSLALGLAREPGGADLRFAISANEPASAASFVRDLEEVTAPDRVSFYRSATVSGRAEVASEPLFRLKEAILRRHVAELDPDVLVLNHDIVSGPSGLRPERFTPAVIAATLFDLVPFEGERADRDCVSPAAVANLRDCEIVITSSAAVRRVSIERLGLAPDRVAAVPACPAPCFTPTVLTPDDQLRARQAVGARRAMVIVHDDERFQGNVVALLEAFARLPTELRRSHQVVLLNVQDAEARRRQSDAVGLAPDEVLPVSVQPTELEVLLYNACKVAYFPSQGLGFPICALEAMCCGAPALGARGGGFEEIAAGVSQLVDATSPDLVAEALTATLSSREHRLELTKLSHQAASAYGPQRTSRTILEALRIVGSHANLATSQSRRPVAGSLLTPESVGREFVDILGSAGVLPDARVIASSVDDVLFSVPILANANAKRLLVDVTATNSLDHRSGIQRVVKELVSVLYRERVPVPALVQAVRLHEGRLVSAEGFVTRLFDRERQEPDLPVVIRPGDDLLMLDSSWHAYDDFAESFHRIRSHRGRIHTVVYDLVPLTHPETTDDGIPDVHRTWLGAAAMRSDGLVCISRAVADELLSLVEQGIILTRRDLKIGWFHLGSDIKPLSSEAFVRPELAQIVSEPSGTFLMVGTIEPRKAHGVALDAFERLWARGFEGSLCILGKAGWNVERLTDRILRHREYGKRLHWVQDPTDSEILTGYRSARALVFPSLAEGYGLPVVEAIRSNLPVICSDIPVLREIAGGSALYFSVGDPDALAELVRRVGAGEVTTAGGTRAGVDWRESKRQLLDVLYGGQWYADLSDTQARFRERLKTIAGRAV